MKLSKKILPLLMCFSLILTSVGTAFAAEMPTFETDSLPEGRTVISTVKGVSTSDFTPTYGAKAAKPKITVNEGTPQSLSIGKNTITVPTDVDISKVNKVYLWRGLGSIKPVCDPALVK